MIHGVQCITKALLGIGAVEEYIENKKLSSRMLVMSAESSDIDIDTKGIKADLSHAHAAGTVLIFRLIDIGLLA